MLLLSKDLVAISLVLLLCVSSATSECSRPTVTSSYFVADDATFHFSTVFVAEFMLKCQNDAKDLPIYAEINGRLVPAALAQDSSRYQVSWTTEHEKADAGTYKVNLFTEDGYALVRKAQRNNDDISKIVPLHTIDVDHKGSSKGPWIQSPMLAALISAAVFYHAYSLRKSLQS